MSTASPPDEVAAPSAPEGPPARHLRALGPPLTGALVLGAVSTFGDWLWARFIPDGAVVPGIVHGAAIFLVIAAVLGWAAHSRRATRRLLGTLPLVGMGLAAVFYPLAMVVGYLGALLTTWVLMWLAIAALQRWARRQQEPTARTLLRGTLAALGAGLAFAAISGIWTQPDPDGPNLLWHLLCWTFAFFPGLAALLLGHGPRP